jgi:hypothetical protein
MADNFGDEFGIHSADHYRGACEAFARLYYWTSQCSRGLCNPNLIFFEMGYCKASLAASMGVPIERADEVLRQMYSGPGVGQGVEEVSH